MTISSQFLKPLATYARPPAVARYARKMTEKLPNILEYQVWHGEHDISARKFYLYWRENPLCLIFTHANFCLFMGKMGSLLWQITRVIYSRVKMESSGLRSQKGNWQETFMTSITKLPYLVSLTSADSKSQRRSFLCLFAWCPNRKMQSS